MVTDIALGGLGALGRLALYFKNASKTKETNIPAITKLINENILFIQYLIEIENAIKIRAGEGTLPSFESACKVLEATKAFLDKYHSRDNSKLLNAITYNNEIKQLLTDMREQREKLFHELDVFFKTHPLPPAPIAAPVAVPVAVPAYEPAVAPPPEPAFQASGFATLYLYKNHPTLAKLREEYKHFKIVPSDPLYQIGLSLLEDNEFEQAVIWLKRANTPRAHFNLGRIYRKGAEGVPKDLDIAKAYYEQASEQTTDFQAATHAALDLGVVLADPDYSEKDMEGARTIWTNLSQDDYVKAHAPHVAKAASDNLAHLSERSRPGRPPRQ